jgi:hypothetical protein
VPAQRLASIRLPAACRLNLLTAVGAAVLTASIWRFGISHTALIVVLLGTSVLSVLLHDMPTDNAGHRAGGHGYGGLRPQVQLDDDVFTCL